MGHPADQMLDQGLGNAGVHIVVGHVVTDSIGAPAKGQFAEIAGSDHQGVSQVGDTKKV